MDIDTIRQEIDQTNREIIELFSRRLMLSKQIAHLKKEGNLAILEKKREDALRQEVQKLAEANGLSPEVMQKIFTEFVDYSKEEMQKEIE